MQTIDLTGAQATFTIAKRSGGPQKAEIRGFSDGELVARYRTEV